MHVGVAVLLLFHCTQALAAAQNNHNERELEGRIQSFQEQYKRRCKCDVPLRVSYEVLKGAMDEVGSYVVPANCKLERSDCASDFVDVVDKLHNFEEDASKIPHLYGKLVKKYQKIPHQMEVFANKELLDLSPHATIAQHSACSIAYKKGREGDKSSEAELFECARVDKGDLKAWQDLFDAANGEEWPHCDNLRNLPCLCALVACENGRIVGISLDHVDVKSELILPDSLGTLSKLRSFWLSEDEFGYAIPESFTQLEELEVLNLSLSKGPNPLPAGFHKLAPTLRALYLSAGLKAAIDYSIVAPHICSLHQLRLLSVQAGFQGPFPACFGSLTELRRLQLNTLGYVVQNQVNPEGYDQLPPITLPEEWGTLKKLAVFYSFHNGNRACPPRNHPRREECRPLYQAKAELSMDDAPWQCPWEGIQGPIPESWKNMESMEKFWVDANHLTGPIPEWMGTHWKKLRSLDLFNNRFEGPIPSTFTKLKLLELVQLQDNQLSGPVPRFDSFKRLRILNLALNKGLTGSIGRMRPQCESLLAGTSVTREWFGKGHREL